MRHYCEPIAALLIWIIIAVPVWAERPRLALVIGNAAYVKSPLDNPVDDAQDLAVLLEEFGFEVMLRTNIGLREMRETVQRFGKQVQDGGVALFYYSGHGLQSKNENYLLPLSAKISGEADIPYETLSANRVLGHMEEHNPHGLNIVILDACRNNPYKGFLKNSQGGLAKMTGETETLIAYATAADHSAYGNSGARNSIYTGQLLATLRHKPHLPITDLFLEVSGKVAAQTSGTQKPWLSLSLTQQASRQFCFAAPAPTPLPTQAPTVTPIPPTPAPPPTVTPIPSSFRENVTGMDFVWIPGGCFQMGQTEAEKSWLIQQIGEDDYNRYFGDELPRHKVCLEGFYLGQYEVTNAQYRQWKRDHDSGDFLGHSLNGDPQPVVMVSWEEATAFADWLTEQHHGKYTFRLPSEAQWEYAARADTTTMRYWGDDPDAACAYANVADETLQQDKSVQKWLKEQERTWTYHSCDDGFVVTAPVGSFRANAWDLYDMLGNVWEWCADSYEAGYDSASPAGALRGTLGDGKAKVLRGGSWGNYPGKVRSAIRGRVIPADRNVNVGFRLVVSPRTP